MISSLAPGKSASFSIAFQPVSAGNRTAVLSLAADPDKAVLFEIKILGSGNAFLESWLSNMGVADDPAGNPDGDALNSTWTMVTTPAGSSATLSNSTSATPTFVADATGRFESYKLDDISEEKRMKGTMAR